MKPWLPAVLIVAFLLVQVLVFELWALRTGDAWTISRTIHEASQQWPLVVILLIFGLGVLVGHLFAVKP